MATHEGADGPRTREEFLALPEGGGFGAEIRVINGKRYTVPIAPSVIAPWLADDAIRTLQDDDGVWWSVGRYADGQWFRRREN
jgi:hypothetical protein